MPPVNGKLRRNNPAKEGQKQEKFKCKSAVTPKQIFRNTLKNGPLLQEIIRRKRRMTEQSRAIKRNACGPE